MKTISIPIMKKETTFAGWQEAAWKDVEHTFGVLQNKWQLLASPVEMWDEVCIQDLVTSCIILHNMMVQQQLEVERNAQATTLKKVCHKTMTMMMGIVILPMKLRIISICWRWSCHMGICVIHNYNFSKIKWNSGHMIKWLCMNNRRCYMMKWNISTYNKQSYHIWSRGFYIDYIGCNDKVAQVII